MSRNAAIAAFLERAGWGAAVRAPLAGDASRRRYERLTAPGGACAVLMDAAPELGEDVRPFLRIARHLAGLGLSPPAILAADERRGLALIEDLGDDLYARVVARRPEAETALYEAAVDLLVALHGHAPPADLPAYGPAEMAERAGLAALWYRPGLAGRFPDDADEDAAATLAQATRAAIDAHAPGDAAMVLRDYHAENLLWLPGRQGAARVGLLDFQDAARGHPAYDLVSLVQDARRDVAADLHDAMIARYAGATGQNRADLQAACAVLGAQRAMRILGVFARLALRDGKPAYAGLVPRVWGLLQRDTAHPACADLAEAVARTLPAPDASGLDRIRARAGTVADPAPVAP
jgi:hypothetical protein